MDEHILNGHVYACEKIHTLDFFTKEITMSSLEPELGQMVFGNPWGDHACPRWCDALIHELLDEIKRVFWNRNQREWNMSEDPCIPGIVFRPYYWGDDETEAAKPNLMHGSVEVRWYKHPLRSSSLNVEAAPEVLVPWFESALAAICAFGQAMSPLA